MDDSAMPSPKQKKRATNKRRHVPAELVSEILLNLPTKSLLRFSSVSKSWNSVIFEPGFIKRHSAVPGRVRIALVAYGSSKASTFLIPPTSSNIPTAVDVTELVLPFGNIRYHVMASCGELWLVRARESLYLWSPSVRTYKQVPKPTGIEKGYFLGLGYESAVDDYKILKIPNQDGGGMFELYSVRNDSWRSIIQHFPKDTRNYTSPCVLVSGKLHWVDNPFTLGAAIISFDLSTERFGEVGRPPMYYHEWLCVEEMSVLKGKLCLSMDGLWWLDIWVMEEYGVTISWRRKFSITCLKFEPTWPLYLYENGDVIFWVYDGEEKRRRLFVYDETTRREVDVRNFCQRDGFGFLYVDSVVAPWLWSQ